MEETIKVQTDKLIHAIRESEVYQNYQIQKEKICRIPELKQQIDEYRTKRYELQSIEDSTLLFDKMEEFERQYQSFGEDPMVEAYLTAELDFCREIQDVYKMIVAALDFE